MAESSHLDAAHAAYGRCDWARARERFSLAADERALSGDDLDQWGYAALWERDLDSAISLFDRAADAYRDAGDEDLEAFVVLQNAQLGVMSANDTLVGVALARAERVLDRIPECEAHAFRAWGMGHLTNGTDTEAATPMLEEALETARRVGSPTVEALSLMTLAHNSIRHGAVRDGLRMIDAAAALALSGDVAWLAVGAVLCGTIYAHRDVGDWKRAAEWTDVTQRWLDRTRVSIFPGLCRVHRCEVSRLRGELGSAEDDAELGCEELAQLNKPMAGHGYHELGEIRLRRGDLEGAEIAFRTAIEFGADAQPGLGRLRLAQGDVESARRGLEDAITGRSDRAIGNRPYVLPVLATAALLMGDTARAQEATAQLADLAIAYDSDAYRAAAEQARGEVALHEGELDSARGQLRDAWEMWCSVDAPYEAASARVLLSDVAVAERDRSQARLDLEAARATFERIGASLAVGQVDDRLATLAAPTASDDRVERAFMFTDIVDSTRLQIALGDEAWDRLLAWHDRTLREAFETHQGEEVKHEGDGFFVAFRGSDDAVRCGLGVQARLARQRDDHGFAPDVRIGVHCGSATARDGDYIGRTVTETARIAGAANAGEVLCSDASLPRGSISRETRRLDLKGIDEPVTVHLVTS